MRQVVLGVACWWLSNIAYAAGAEQVLGHWLTPNDNAVIEIYAEKDRFHGRIVALKDPLYAPGHENGLGGKPKVDRMNPDSGLRTRPIIGLKLVENFVFVGDGRYEHGSIYDPREGDMYQCEMALQADGTLEVHGFIGISLFGKTQVWRRKP